MATTKAAWGDALEAALNVDEDRVQVHLRPLSYADLYLLRIACERLRKLTTDELRRKA